MALNPNTISGKIYLYLFRLLEEHPDGLQWKDLNRMVKEKYPDFHPKTINGCVWKLLERFPEKVHKPEKGKFKWL